MKEIIMDIEEVKDVIMKWISSCDRIEQLMGLEKSVPALLDSLFLHDKKVSDDTLNKTKHFLSAWIKDNKELITFSD